MFLKIFTISLTILTLYCFISKKFLYLYIPCMLFLPEYYGIEFSSSLPLLTVTRIMTLILFIYTFVNAKKEINIKSFFSKRNIFLFGYFLFRIIPNLYYATNYNEAIKVLFSIIIEQFLFLVAFYVLSPSKDEIVIIVKAVVWTASILFIIGIFESLTFIRPFDSLYSVNRYLMNEHYVRLGLLRATTTLGMPGMYSNMCLLVLPLILYLFNTTSQKRYLIICFADILAGIHSGSRSFIFYIVIVFGFYIIFVLQNKSNQIRCIKHIAEILLGIIVIATVFSISNPTYKYFYVGSAKSILNELGANFDLDADAPTGVNGYGGNSSLTDKFQGGIASRKVELSGIPYSLSRNPLFGLGAGALSRHQLKYSYSGYWNEARALDVGLVDIIVYEGLFGLIGYIFLFLYLLRAMKYSVLSLFQKRIWLLIIMCYLLAMFSTVNIIGFLMLFTCFAIKFPLNHKSSIETPV